MKRSLSMSRVLTHPSTLAVFSGLLGAFLGFLLNVAAGGNSSQLLWIALTFALVFSLIAAGWQEYTQEQTGRQWMTMLQEMVFQTYFLTVLADKPELSELSQQRFGQVLKTLRGDQQASMLRFFSHNGLPAAFIGDALQGSSGLVGADLQQIELSTIHLEQANLSRANLTGANLREAHLSGTMLYRADLSGANLSQASLPQTDLRGVRLRAADLSGADLSESRMGMQSAGRDGVRVQVGARFYPVLRADLSQAVLTRAKLRGADLVGADLSGAKMQGVDLARANLGYANLQGSDLSGATLTNAMLVGANLQGADLTGATLTSAVLDQADLRAAIVTDEQLETAISGKNTKRAL